MTKVIENLIGKIVAEDRATLESGPSAATSLKAGPGIARFPAFVLSIDLSSVPPACFRQESENSKGTVPLGIVPLTFVVGGAM